LQAQKGFFMNGAASLSKVQKNPLRLEKQEGVRYKNPEPIYCRLAALVK
jgi:hypothetical protein